MEAFKTHGAFSWMELNTSDPAAAAEFYGNLFGWDVKPPNAEMGGYRIVNVGAAGVGGITAPFPGQQTVPPNWSAYVTVDDVDKTLAQCTALGGKICSPAMDIPGVGRMAVIQDPHGAMINVITYVAM